MRDLLRDIAEASDSDWAAVTRGEPFAKVLATDSREIAVAGAVRIAASSERLVDRYREVENLKRSAIVLDLGRLSKPPRAADLATVPLEDYSLDLRDCRPGECRVRLGEPEIARFHREVDWACGELARAFADRLERGPDGIRGGLQPRRTARRCPPLPTSEEPLSVPAELSLLVSRFGFLNAFAPAFYAYLREFGPGGPNGLDEVMYWSKEDFGVRPVLRLSHQAIYRASPRAIVIATNQIYADHYLDAGLTLTMTIDATDAGAKPAFYMVSVSRARTRSLGGMLRSFVRSTVQNRSRDALRKILAVDEDEPRTALTPPGVRLVFQHSALSRMSRYKT